jgi:hypothetical protein
VRDSREWELIQRFSYPLSAYFNLVQPETKGKPCYHPAFSYRLSFDGTINVSCAGRKQNIFTDGIPELPLFLPHLPKGDHLLVAQAVTAGGTSGELPAFTIRIVH